MEGAPDSASIATAAATLPERSDAWLVFILGGDLQTATLRIGLYAVGVCAVLAVIAWLVG